MGQSIDQHWFTMAAQECKAKGNKDFQAGNFEEAVKHYTDAIGHDANDHVFYSNRSACLSSLNRYDEALSDANKCIELKPDFAKAYSRKGAALHGAGKLQEATAAYEDGLKIDPNNAALKSGLADVKSAGDQQGQASILNMFMSPEGQAKLASDPETAAYMQDPQFMQMLQMCQQAPKAKPKAPVKELTEEEKADLKLKEEAAAEKALGTTAYKAKDFETAMTHYQKAYEIYVKDISPVTNMAACKFEQDDFDGCIETCLDAIEKGREVMCDYTLIGKAFVSIGNTHMRRAARAEGFEAKEPFYNEAIEAYAKSLLEHYTNDAFDRQKKAKQMLKKHKEADYACPVKAAEAKETGNEHFKKGEFVEAQKFYTEAIARDQSNHLYLSNRATCYIKMNEMTMAEKDLDACIKMDPTFKKAYLNKANILYHRKEFHKVIPLYELVLELAEETKDEASKQKAKDGLAQTQMAIQRAQHDEPDEERLRRAQADPEIQQILADPMVQQAIKDFQENPKYAQNALKDPAMAAKLSKLAAAGILRFQ